MISPDIFDDIILPMRNLNIIFSPTGGVEAVSSIISPEGETINLVKHDCSVDIGPDDRVLLAVPSFAGRVPAFAVDRIGQLNGNGARCILVVVYGNRAYEDTLLELRELALSIGLLPIAAISAVAEHSMVRDIAAGRPDGSDRKVLEEMAGKVDWNSVEVVSVPGKTPYKERHPFATIPVTLESCINCGLCHVECPTWAIRGDGTTDEKLCIACMRCISVCAYGSRVIPADLVAPLSNRLHTIAADRKEPELFC